MRLSALGLIVISLFVAAPDADADWVRVRSANFTFIGDAPESQIRAIARQAEQFREVMLRLLPPAQRPSMAPTVVVVFRTHQTFYPYMPKRNGRVFEVGGVFSPCSDGIYMAVNGDSRDFAFETVSHQYAYSLMQNTVGRMPLWLNEGLASVYETYEERDGGKGALIGRAKSQHVDRLRASTFVPLSELMAVDTSSPVYTDSRREMFDAESWVLTHYLIIGNPARAAQFGNYLNAIAGGADADAAFDTAFGDISVLQREVQLYARNLTFLAALFTFDEKVTREAPPRGEKLSDAESQAYLGELLGRVDREDEGRALLKKAIAAAPDTARAYASLGRLDARANNLDEAVTQLERAVMLSPAESSYQASLGRVLYRKVQGRSGEDAETKALRERVRQVLSAVWERDQNDVDTAGSLGYLELVGGNLDKAVTVLTRGLTLAPNRDQYRLLLGVALMRQRDLDGATRQLGVLLARGATAEIRDQARSMLTQVAALRNAAIGQPAPSIPTPPVTVAAAPDAALPPSAPSTAAPAAAPPQRPPANGRLRLDLRQVADGERRVRGVFESITCGQNRVVLMVRTDAGLQRFAAARILDVDFVSYRPGAPGSINCGTQTPLPVLATYRDLPAGALRDVDGQAVAIELLPDGFTQP